MGKKRCFVVQGFGKKADFETGRTLDLDESYVIIKKAVESAGLACQRADEILHSGSIDVPMYQQLLEADVVIADLSTSNWNAAYELGVRHALRPFSTIVVAEEKFSFPFDINHIAINTYQHLGPELGRKGSKEFKARLQTLIEEVVKNQQDDSPVYEFLDLEAPCSKKIKAVKKGRASKATDEREAARSMRAMMSDVAEARSAGNWRRAIKLLGKVHEIGPRDTYVVQQLALATYKSEKPTLKGALLAARKIMAKKLQPKTTNDPETLGLWSAIHKRLWEVRGKRTDLDEAIRASEKGFYLKRNHYNGVNFAFLLNVRASQSEQHEGEAIADFVRARQVRRQVIEICTEELEGLPKQDSGMSKQERSKLREDKYWLLATLREASVGLGAAADAKYWKKAAAKAKPEKWMVESTAKQLVKLEKELERSPISQVKGQGSDRGVAAEPKPKGKKQKKGKKAGRGKKPKH